MSIRTALVAAMLLVITAVTAILCVLGVMSVNRSVIREAQARVDHDLRVVGTHYQRLIDSLGRRFENRVQGVEPGLENAMRTVRQLRDELDFTILNLCDAKGKPVAEGADRGGHDHSPRAGGESDMGDGDPGSKAAPHGRRRGS